MTFLWDLNVVQSVVSLKHVVQQGCGWFFPSTFAAQRPSPTFPRTISPLAETIYRALSAKARLFLASGWYSVAHILDTPQR